MRLLEAQAPYTPLGGWFSPGADPHARTRPMWFQNDWVHDTFAAEGSEMFLHHAGYIEAPRQFYDAEVVEPTSVYVNLMVAIADGGPAHTDNPRFHGRDRTNTPMWLLRAMLWSGLFDRLRDRAGHRDLVDERRRGWRALLLAGRSRPPPDEHVGAMANTALIGDNHGMFHQVGPIGPFDERHPGHAERRTRAGRRRRTGDWAVTDHGEVHTGRRSTPSGSACCGRPTSTRPRASAPRAADTLSLQDVADDVQRRPRPPGHRGALRPGRFDDLTMKAAIATVYPEAVPVGRLVSAFG